MVSVHFSAAAAFWGRPRGRRAICKPSVLAVAATHRAKVACHCGTVARWCQGKAKPRCAKGLDRATNRATWGLPWHDGLTRQGGSGRAGSCQNDSRVRGKPLLAISAFGPEGAFLVPKAPPLWNASLCCV